MRFLGKIGPFRSKRKEEIHGSFQTETTTDTLQSDAEHGRSYGCAADAAFALELGLSHGNASPVSAPKFLSEVTSDPNSYSRQVAFEEFMKSQELQHVANRGETQNCIGGCTKSSVTSGQSSAECVGESVDEKVSSVVPTQSNHKLDYRSAEGCSETPAEESQTGRKHHRPSQRSASLSVSRRPSSASVSTMSMSSVNRKSETAQRRSRSISQSRRAWKVPQFRRSLSRKPTKTAMAADMTDPSPRRPSTEPEQQITRTQREPPADLSPGYFGMDYPIVANSLEEIGPSSKAAARRREARFRSRSQSVSRNYSEEKDGGDTRKASGRREQQKSRLRCRSASQMRYPPKDKDDRANKDVGNAGVAEEASASVGPMMWISFQTPENEDEGSASTNEMSEALAMIAGVQSENASLRRSVVEATELAKGMGEKLADFVKVHEASVKDYEEKLVSLREGLHQEQEGLSAKLDAVREENKVLRAALIVGEEEFKEKERIYRKSMKKVNLERKDALQACRALQKRMSLLQQASNEPESLEAAIEEKKLVSST